MQDILNSNNAQQTIKKQMIECEYIIYKSFDQLLNVLNERKNSLLRDLKTKFQIKLESINDCTTTNSININVGIMQHETETIVNAINNYGSILIDSGEITEDKEQETKDNETESFWDNTYSHNSFTLDRNIIHKEIYDDDTFCNAFSNEIVSEPSIKTWKLQILKSLDNKPLNCVIGIIDTDKIDADMEGDFAESHNGGYGLSANNGNIYHSSDFGIKYATKLIENDIITIQLNMNNGTLKYIINNTDYGIAFDGIDCNKSYQLAIAMDQREQIKVVNA